MIQLGPNNQVRINAIQMSALQRVYPQGTRNPYVRDLYHVYNVAHYIAGNCSRGEWQYYYVPNCQEELRAIRRLTRTRMPKFHWFTGVHRQRGNTCACGYVGPLNTYNVAGFRRGAPAQTEFHNNALCPLALQACLQGDDGLGSFNFSMPVPHIDPFNFGIMMRPARFDAKYVCAKIALSYGMECELIVSELTGARECFLRVGAGGPKYALEDDMLELICLDAFRNKGSWKKALRLLPENIKQHINAEIRLYREAA
jgi:hypothetical protein